GGAKSPTGRSPGFWRKEKKRLEAASFQQKLFELAENQELQALRQLLEEMQQKLEG
ncbi:MAG: hypothetical protein HC913_11010, partial [Microscillaceae bacterium]|nr:hypothetical protein [Microscillaceae bacterium]